MASRLAMVAIGIAWLPMWALFTAIIVIAHGLRRQTRRWIAAHDRTGGAARIRCIQIRIAPALAASVPDRLRRRSRSGCGPVRHRLVRAHQRDRQSRARPRHRSKPGPVTAFSSHRHMALHGGRGRRLCESRRAALAKIEAQAARMQLDTLRSQLHPHFLFNALHTVVHLIPSIRARRRAVEQLAGVLRSTIEEQRDLLRSARNWFSWNDYLAIEAIRFGDRLSRARRYRRRRAHGLAAFVRPANAGRKCHPACGGSANRVRRDFDIRRAPRSHAHAERRAMTAAAPT